MLITPCFAPCARRALSRPVIAVRGVHPLRGYVKGYGRRELPMGNWRRFAVRLSFIAGSKCCRRYGLTGSSSGSWLLPCASTIEVGKPTNRIRFSSVARTAGRQDNWLPSDAARRDCRRWVHRRRVSLGALDRVRRRVSFSLQRESAEQ